MKKFFDAVKVNLHEDTERYFEAVEIESVKKTKDGNALNFYLVSKDIIPYKYIVDAKNEIAKQVLNVNLNLHKAPVNIFLKYELSDSYTKKLIFEEIKVDLYKELKDKNRVQAAVFDNSKFTFDDSDKLIITFDENKTFIDEQEVVYSFIKEVYNDRFGIDINIEKKYEKIDNKKNSPDFYANSIEREKDRAENIGTSDKKEKIADEEKVESKDTVPQANISNNVSKKSMKRSYGLNDDDTDLIYGKVSKTKYKEIEIKEIITEMENIKAIGTIYKYDLHDTKNGRTVFSVYINDGTGSTIIKIWGNPDDKKLFNEKFKIGDVIEVCGKSENDMYIHSYTIHPYTIKKVAHRNVVEFGKVGDDDYYNVLITDRVDDEKKKRVELHLHTKSSAKDAIGEVNAYIETARKWGMKAMAITDHGCVNALADAYEYIKSKKYDDIKIINGVEGYLVEDFETYYFDKDGIESNKSHNISSNFVVYDFITTGYNRKKDAIVKIEARKIEEGKVVDTFISFVKYLKPLPFSIKNKEGMRESDVSAAKELKDVLKDFMTFSKDSVLVTLNKNSTWKLSDLLKENDIESQNVYLDLVILSRLMLPNLKTEELFSIASELKVNIKGITDRKKEEKKKGLLINERLNLSSEILTSLIRKMSVDLKIDDTASLKNVLEIGPEFIKRQKYYHIILLAKNDIGRVNLYKLVSDSHIHYMYRRPRIPRSLLMKYREGLILGSACIVGEFMNAIREGRNDEELKQIAFFYDYLEVQPTMNNSFLLKEDSENFKSIKDLEDLNKKVIEIGEILNKPVVATCDCHYIEKEDKIDRTILQFGSMYKKTNLDKDGNVKEDLKNDQESSGDEELYFRTTREMLDEFAYLGVDKAYEIVVKNTNLINDMIENIIPLRLDKCPPVIKGSDEDLKKSCYENLNKIYGESLSSDSKIAKRLDEELKYIIDNGYSVMYMAAKKLIDYSKENGYPVGSRGSVGSSLAATLSGVSEVNPLPPHYICPKCHHLEYETEETKKYSNETGLDMPDKKCPECGAIMKKDGINIPFETFLGIPGDEKAQKEPDIDLNFCSVFQSDIHNHTVEMFGRENTFKAGTVGTVAMKTAYGYVMKYVEEEKKRNRDFDISREQITYHRNKIVNCKNTTGQHPGGMIVVPEGESIYTFTPIQYPADKDEKGITTHYDYHKIDQNLLKLDILGHDAPLMLKKLFEYTGVDFNNVLSSKEEVDEAVELFKSTDSLNIKPSDISGTRLGCLTIPEFGTDNAMNMCEEAKPQSVSDLIRISGLAHGTDVWNNNVRDLIKNGDCTLQNAICCRDDIMLYLIDKGLDHGLAFNIMESVRKGKGLKDSWETEMRTHEVPEWYIGCCKKIKYMFPKAHAAAYVLAALRIAYYKIHYPLEYYAAYFSVRKDGFNYSLMMQSKEEIHFQIEKLAKRLNDKNSDEELSVNDKDLYMCYRIVEEMKARGIEFCPIDIYSAKATDFIIVDNKIMPSFNSIPGIGDEVAKNLEEKAKKGEYSSIENFKERTGVTRTKIDEMKAMGLLPGLKESEENTIFDLLK